MYHRSEIFTNYTPPFYNSIWIILPLCKRCRVFIWHGFRYSIDMKTEIKKAEFVKGVIGDDYSLGDDLPQVAFFGRSNVGKSSVINSLINRKDLVRSSKKPGKTREANFFRIDETFYFIDFPGYGYAKCSQKDRDKLIKRILWYIQYSRVRPKVVVLIVDIQVGITLLDNEMIKTLKENKHQVIIVANKSDKLNQKELFWQISKTESKTPGFQILPYSAKTKKGKDKLLNEIFKYIAME